MNLTNRRWTDKFYFLTQSSHIKQAHIKIHFKGSKNRNKKTKDSNDKSRRCLISGRLHQGSANIRTSTSVMILASHKNEIIKVLRRCISKRWRCVPKKVSGIQNTCRGIPDQVGIPLDACAFQSGCVLRLLRPQLTRTSCVFEAEQGRRGRPNPAVIKELTRDHV